MAIFVKFHCFTADLGLGKHNLNTDTLKIFLTNSTPSVSTHTKKSDLTEITAEHGYSAGGVDIQNTYAQTGGVGTLTGVDAVLTGTGGSFGAFRYAVLYNDTHADDILIAYLDYGASITIADTETLTFDVVTSVLTIT